MNRFRIVRITSKGKHEELSPSELERVEFSQNLKTYYDSLEKNGLFIRDTLYRIHNSANFYADPLSFFIERQQYLTEGSTEFFKILQDLQRYEQHDPAFIPPLSVIMDDRPKRSNTLQYVKEITPLLYQRIPLFAWFTYLPVPLQIVILNDVYSQYIKNRRTVRSRGHYMFTLLSEICKDMYVNKKVIYDPYREFHEYYCKLFQKNKDIYYLVFTIFTPFAELNIPESLDTYDKIVALRKYRYKINRGYKEYKTAVIPYIKATDIFRHDLPEFKAFKDIMTLNPLYPPPPAPFGMDKLKTIVIKNPLTKK